MRVTLLLSLFDDACALQLKRSTWINRQSRCTLRLPNNRTRRGVACSRCRVVVRRVCWVVCPACRRVGILGEQGFAQAARFPGIVNLECLQLRLARPSMTSSAASAGRPTLQDRRFWPPHLPPSPTCRMMIETTFLWHEIIDAIFFL